MASETALVRRRLVERYGSPHDAEHALLEAMQQGVLSLAEVELLRLALAAGEAAT